MALGLVDDLWRKDAEEAAASTSLRTFASAETAPLASEHLAGRGLQTMRRAPDLRRDPHVAEDATGFGSWTACGP